jgi:BMFP domain-containing protein YqiC
METLSIHQLERDIAFWQEDAQFCKYWVDVFQRLDNRTELEAWRKLLLDTLNTIAKLAAKIATLNLKGETDAITTYQALTLLDIDYTYENGAFYIHS